MGWTLNLTTNVRKAKKKYGSKEENLKTYRSQGK
jgi:hypothetical protein